ncbi:uncharacterized protein PHALS_07342 [Plasmopara halstedii]|uniref:Uncharacterized protein n=1 Tax=Plasmopara halstedii TaxID=4781 RepID=A0A0P1B6P9_PLAHL|nr:uncharacterized protein PHALS_07342 [Plasmopara halstedii]CEG49584.1 hypothetical protein PHALS_07342 [Plasmopara halstedii]|eukprot:XP_024585953.1 hypothetical protein PHALS_07342 [Plasmopara halstedii]
MGRGDFVAVDNLQAITDTKPLGVLQQLRLLCLSKPPPFVPRNTAVIFAKKRYFHNASPLYKSCSLHSFPMASNLASSPVRKRGSDNHVQIFTFAYV